MTYTRSIKKQMKGYTPTRQGTSYTSMLRVDADTVDDTKHSTKQEKSKNEYSKTHHMTPSSTENIEEQAPLTLTGTSGNDMDDTK
jgi:hypothetical protein